MTTATLKSIKSLDDIARVCGVERDFIENYANDSNQKSHFYIIQIRKRGRRRTGEYRIVFKAKETRLAQLHRSASMIVINSAAFGDHIQGFLKKRSTRTNASKHLAKKVLLHADIKDFFDSITTEKVRDAFVTEGASVSIADTLAKACTIDGLLRQGTRCGPTIANLVCFDMDSAFLRLARSHDCIYTRYADDLTFSGDQVPSDESVKEILEGRGFKLRDNKCYRQYSGRRQFVTGLNVTDPSHPRLPKRLKRYLRLVMYHVGKRGLNEHFKNTSIDDVINEIGWISGILYYARSIEPELVSGWKKTFDRALAEFSLEMSSDNDHMI